MHRLRERVERDEASAERCDFERHEADADLVRQRADVGRGDAEEEEGASEREEREREEVQFSFATSPRPPESDRDEVMEVREREIGDVGRARHEREERDGDRDAGGANQERAARDDERAARRDEPRANAAAEEARDEREADEDPDRPSRVQAWSRDEVAHVADDVRNAEDDRAEEEKPHRRERRRRERDREEHAGVERDARLALRDERRADPCDHREHRAANAIERPEPRLCAHDRHAESVHSRSSMADRNLTFDFTAPAVDSQPPPEAKAAPKKPVDEAPRVLTVAELDRAIRGTLERSFAASTLVEGEVTGARAAPSGHIYLCLKDEEEEATIDVVIYKSSLTPRMRALLVDGARVRMRGRPTFWPPRGKLQFVADRADATGKGALLEALERLKAKLAAEGLFAAERKRTLPIEPRVLGVVTSANGAAIHDVCRVAFRRGGARILLAPALVQGVGAADSIRRALLALQRVALVDVIIVGRGGGSSEDLAAFNDEALVRTVAACRVPVVSAVGHEVDVTLTDFAADARAATPSQAAEMLVPDTRARRERLVQARARLARAIRGRVTEGRVALGDIQSKLGDPRLAIASHQQSLDDLGARLEAATRGAVVKRRDTLSRAQERLAYVHPRAVVARERASFVRIADRLAVVMRGAIERRAGSLGAVGARLDALSPLKVLSRGYAIATSSDGRAVRGARDVRAGDRVNVRVDGARFDAEVTSVEELASEATNE